MSQGIYSLIQEEASQYNLIASDHKDLGHYSLQPRQADELDRMDSIYALIGSAKPVYDEIFRRIEQSDDQTKEYVKKYVFFIVARTVTVTSIGRYADNYKDGVVDAVSTVVQNQFTYASDIISRLALIKDLVVDGSVDINEYQRLVIDILSSSKNLAFNSIDASALIVLGVITAAAAYHLYDDKDVGINAVKKMKSMVQGYVNDRFSTDAKRRIDTQ